MVHLVPCPGCSRHVRTTEGQCPFCEAALPRDLERKVVPAATRRLDRLAAFTFATSLVATACSGTDGVIGPEPEMSQGTDGSESAEDELRKRKKKKKDAGAADSGCSKSDPGAIQPMYGGPPFPSPCPTDPPPPPQDDAGGIVPMYGAPPPPPADAGPPLPARDGGAIVPMYGLPAPPEDDAGGVHVMYGVPPVR